MKYSEKDTGMLCKIENYGELVLVDNLHCDLSGRRERCFGKYSSSSELCFGSRQLGRLAGS